MKLGQAIRAAIPFPGLSRLRLPHPPAKHPYCSHAGEGTSLLSSWLGLLLFFPLPNHRKLFCPPACHRCCSEILSSLLAELFTPFPSCLRTGGKHLSPPWEASPRPPKLKCFSQAAILHPAPLRPQPQFHTAVEKYLCAYSAPIIYLPWEWEAGTPRW